MNRYSAIVGNRLVTWEYFAWVAAVVLFFDIYGGALRFYFSAVGLEWLVFLPKALMLVFIFISIMRGVFSGFARFSYIFVCSYALIFFAIFVAYLNDLFFSQVIFGLSIFLPIVFGLHLAAELKGVDFTGIPAVRLVLYFLFFSVVFGVFLNLLGDMPWSGAGYNLAGVSVEVNRDWMADGVTRLAGFSRMSTQAGCQVAALVFIIASIWVGNTRFFSFAIILLALVVAVLTTTKTAVLGILIVSVLFVFKSRYLFIPALVLIVGLIVSLPLVAVSTHIALDDTNPVLKSLLFSFNDRLESTWPITFSLIEKYGIDGLGVGMGGVGTPTKAFGGLEAGDVLAGDLALDYTDNLALYLYGTFGVFSAVIVAAFAVAAYKLCVSENLFYRSVGFSMTVLLVSGLTIDMVEMLTAPLIYGLSLGLVFYNNQRRGDG